MSTEIKYDFESSESTEKTQEDVRPNLRIVRCCMNCKFYKINPLIRRVRP